MTDHLRPIDGTGHHPGKDSLAARVGAVRVGVESFDEQFAKTRETAIRTQQELMGNLTQIIYELGRLRGILEERTRSEAAG